MKSVFDASTKEELVSRINSLSKQNNAEWGKMDVFQMLRHCTLCEDMFLGKIKIKRAFAALAENYERLNKSKKPVIDRHSYSKC